MLVGCLQPLLFIKRGQKYFVHVAEGLLVEHQYFTEVFKGSSIAVLLFISSWDQRVGQMEIIFHEEANVDGCEGKEEVTFIVFHLLYKLSISFDKSENQLQRQYSASSKICLRVLALKSQLEPLLAGYFDRLPKVLQVKCFDQIPSLVFTLEENVSLFFEIIECMKFINMKAIVFTKQPLAPVTA